MAVVIWWLTGAAWSEVAAATCLVVGVAYLALLCSTWPHLPSADWVSRWPSKSGSGDCRATRNQGQRSHITSATLCGPKPFADLPSHMAGKQVHGPTCFSTFPNHVTPLIIYPRNLRFLL